MAITETTFEPKLYLVVRKSITTKEITDKKMYDDAGEKLGTFIIDHDLEISGPWTVIYFKWDEDAGLADIGIAFPIASAPDTDALEANGLSIVSIPETNATMTELRGSYEGLGAAHESMMTYRMEHNFRKEGFAAMGVEEYTVGPKEDSNPENWITTIYYFHD